jgi:hypothetical protein
MSVPNEEIEEVGVEVEEPEVEKKKPSPEVADADVEAEVLFQVSHYNKEYGSPASLGDIAFEVQEKDSKVHEAMEKAVKEGTPKVEPAVKTLLDEGLIVETEYGGYVTTPQGDAMIEEPEVQEDLGGTFESKKNKGNPEGEGVAGDLGIPADVEEDKSEMGVPFLN